MGEVERRRVDKSRTKASKATIVPRREQAKRETLETNSWRYLESFERWDANDRARDLFTTDCSRLDPRVQTVRQRVAYITNVYSNGGQATR